VEWFAPDSMQRKSAYASRTDREIEQAVHDALLQDPRVASFEVSADSDYGVVTLTGMVDNLKAREAAEQDAKDTVGAWRIRNHVKVRPTTRVKDEELISSVSAALKRDPYLDRHDIRVSSYNGKVYLYGTLDSEFEKQEAEDVAFRVKGVIDVADYINVPEASPWRNDWEITESVKDQLHWDPVVDSKQVDVSVQNGVATLTGKVDDWYEYSQAAQDAFRGGASGLNNEIHIEHGPRL
jgi:osmotically-inducible protein OsmY